MMSIGFQCFFSLFNPCGMLHIKYRNRRGATFATRRRFEKSDFAPDARLEIK
jgi:hypothetical protein